MPGCCEANVGTPQECGLWPHLLVAVIAYNADFAPWGEDATYRRGLESFREYLHVADPLTCPLWSEFWPKILQDRGQLSRLAEPDIARVLWKDTLHVLCGIALCMCASIGGTR